MRRRVVPDDAAVQVILGSLLGDGRLEGGHGDRRLRIAHPAARADYVWWKYQRLGALVAHPPAPCGDLLAFRTIAHPIFDDLATLVAPSPTERRRALIELLAPLGLAVWMTDVGRLQLRADAFLEPQRRVALAR